MKSIKHSRGKESFAEWMPNRRRAYAAVRKVRTAFDDFQQLIEIDTLSYHRIYNSPISETVSVNRNVYVADEGNMISGFLTCIVFGHQVSIDKLAVHPDSRRLGIGTLMIDFLKSYLDEELREIVCQADIRNGIAQLFLRSCGFKAEKKPIFVELGGRKNWGRYVYVFRYHD